MTRARKGSLSLRSVEIRRRWQQRVSDQQASGIRQTLWCLQNGIQPKYFSHWKGKLAKAAATERAPAPTSVPQVPVTIRPTVAKVVAPSGVGVTVTLPNGIGQSFDLPTTASWKAVRRTR